MLPMMLITYTKEQMLKNNTVLSGGAKVNKSANHETQDKLKKVLPAHDVTIITWNVGRHVIYIWGGGWEKNPRDGHRAEGLLRAEFIPGEDHLPRGRRPHPTQYVP